MTDQMWSSPFAGATSAVDPSAYALRADLMEAVEDAMTFFHLDRTTVLARLCEPSGEYFRRCAEEAPRTVAAWQHFYAQTDALIFGNIAWHAQPTQHTMRSKIAHRIGGLRVLNYGCGLAPESLWAVRQYGGDHVLVDIGMNLAFLRWRIHRHYEAEQGRLICLNPEELRGQIGTLAPFEAIVCLDVLEHLDDPEGLLAEFRQWLTPDGLFIAGAPFAYHQYPDIPDGHLDHHMGKDLRVLCQQAGLHTVWIDPLRPESETAERTLSQVKNDRT